MEPLNFTDSHINFTINKNYFLKPFGFLQLIQFVFCEVGTACWNIKLMQMEFRVHMVKGSQTATGEIVVAATDCVRTEPKAWYIFRFPPAVPLLVSVWCAVQTHTHTHTHTHLSCDVGPVKAHYTAACVAGSLYQTLLMYKKGKIFTDGYYKRTSPPSP
jgi:hypothetical protein